MKDEAAIVATAPPLSRRGGVALRLGVWLSCLALGAAGEMGARHFWLQHREAVNASASGAAREHEGALGQGRDPSGGSGGSVHSRERSGDFSSQRAARLMAALDVTVADGDAAGLAAKEAARREVVEALLDRPEFINTLYAAADPDKRQRVLGFVFAQVASDAPVALWRILDRMDDGPVAVLKGMDSAAGATVLNGAGNAAPGPATEVVLRRAEILGRELVNDALYKSVADREAAAQILQALRAGNHWINPDVAMQLWENEQDWHTGETVPDEALYDPDHSMNARPMLEQSRATAAWIAGDGPAPDAEVLKNWYAGSTEVLEGRFPPQCLEDLAAAGNMLEVDGLVRNMALWGRAADAQRMVEGAKDLPTVGPEHDRLLGILAAGAYAGGSRATDCLRLLSGATGEDAAETVKPAREEILSGWAAQAPEEVRAYLPHIADPALREKIAGLVEEAALDQKP